MEGLYTCRTSFALIIRAASSFSNRTSVISLTFHSLTNWLLQPLWMDITYSPEP